MPMKPLTREDIERLYQPAKYVPFVPYVNQQEYDWLAEHKPHLLKQVQLYWSVERVELKRRLNARYSGKHEQI